MIGIKTEKHKYQRNFNCPVIKNSKYQNEVVNCFALLIVKHT